MEVRYIDAHCHVQFDHYAQDGQEIIDRMRREGVAGIAVGCDLPSSREAAALARSNANLYASIGLHPNRDAHEPFDEQAFRALAAEPKVVAIGECGLDYFRPTEINDEIKKEQKDLFKQHITLAAEIDAPLIVHARPSKGAMDAYADAIGILAEAKTRHPHLRGDIHFFVGGALEAEAFIALGFTISFTAVITFARDYDEVIRSVPLSSILAETDAPYVAPASRRGTRNDPLAVVDVVNTIAEIRNEDPERVRSAILANTRNLFAL
ncbi:TatD family hydrolase [Patescibacteria group bacterium]|nr:TatD family hydrolase [Patescibacteria group bacterium]